MAVLGLATGMAGCLGALVTNRASLPWWIIAAGFLFEGAVVVAGCRYAMRPMGRANGRRFIVALAAAWAVSRLAVAAAFSHSVLLGDDAHLYRFVSQLAQTGLTHEQLSNLSSWYDYPVWLSRAFPIYYPLRLIFGQADLSAVRIANALMGTGTLLFTYLIARRVVGPAQARAAAWLLAVCPYHVFDVLSYTPQIPGTFFFVAGVWLVLETMAQSRPGWKDTLWRGAVLGVILIAIAVQRGGLDLLLLAVAAVTMVVKAAGRKRLAAQAAGTFVLAAVVWYPARQGVDSWIRSHDTHHLRSHVLGFMARGWNLASLGEYWGRYEQLDIAAPRESKSRLLVAVLATEAARQPVPMFAAVPPAKSGKFFMPGFAAITEQELEAGGYPHAATAAMALRLAYAPLLLALAMAGLLTAMRQPRTAWRLLLPSVAMVMAAAAIIFLWETSPRYSHAVHFALVTVAAAGFAALRKQGARAVLSPRGGWVKRGVGMAAATGLAAGALACGTHLVARQAHAYLYADMDGMRAEAGGRVAKSRTSHRWTGAWEREVVIAPGTVLPAALTASWPALPGGRQPGRLSLSLWTDQAPAEPWASCRVVVPHSGTFTVRNLNVLRRGLWEARASGKAGSTVEIEILPPAGQASFALPGPVALGVGYALAEGN